MQPRTLKAIALLLDYPDQALVDHLDALEMVFRAEAGVEAVLDPLFAYLRGADLYQLQENYVALFDRGRGTSLYLFEHVHGESRDRGQAMVDLLAMYNQSGFGLTPKELPDYLPAFLEYLSQQEPAKAQPLLCEIAHLVRNIGENLARRGSHHYFLCSALLILAGETPLDVPFVPIDFGQEPEDFVQIDAAWAEEPVTFGGGCAAPTPDGASVVQFVPREKNPPHATVPL